MVNGRSPVDPAGADGDASGPVSTVESSRSPRGALADPAAVHFDDEERPARVLTGPIAAGVAAVAFAAAVLALWEVFRPLAQGSQFYLIIFLALTLPLVFLVYRSGLPAFGAARTGPARPTVPDWLLAVLTLLVCLYPVNPFNGGYDGFLDRQGLLEPADVLAGAIMLVLVVEA